MTATLAQISQWLAEPSEHRRLEFKEAKSSFSRSRLCKYCVALANAGGGHLILGVTDEPPRRVTGANAFAGNPAAIKHDRPSAAAPRNARILSGPERKRPAAENLSHGINEIAAAPIQQQIARTEDDQASFSKTSRNSTAKTSSTLSRSNAFSQAHILIRILFLGRIKFILDVIVTNILNLVRRFALNSPAKHGGGLFRPFAGLKLLRYFSPQIRQLNGAAAGDRNRRQPAQDFLNVVTNLYHECAEFVPVGINAPDPLADLENQGGSGYGGSN